MRELGQEALNQYFGALNAVQRQAVFRVKGPLLVLAGAGSGKTTVLIRRIENLILFGDAYNTEIPNEPKIQDLIERYIAGENVPPNQLSDAIGKGRVRPWNILAITFTNKAAGELRERLGRLLGNEVGEQVNAYTFHSLCARILRREADRLGYERSFTIYDADDSQRVMKGCLKALNLDDKLFPPKVALSAISRAKDTMQTPEEMKASTRDFRENKLAELYELYAKELKAANAMDFDDLIFQTVRLLRDFPEVRDGLRERYRYIMVDEYQDTSHAQYLLISALAGGHKNLCVVGDDDQSIYKFRGATIENILSFERQFPGAGVIRLEENYRSTSHILNAANQVIAHNTERKGKNLWTSKPGGDKVLIERVEDEKDESARIAKAILENVAGGAKFTDHAILYRMNALSNTLEQALAGGGIPYRIVGGVRFYERKEIKDITAYLTILHNPGDNLRLARIINEPKRQIGPTTVASALEIAAGLGLSLFEVLQQCEQFEPIAKKKAHLLAFVDIINTLTELSQTQPLDILLDEILERTSYRAMLESQGFEGAGRMENILELKSNLIHYQASAPEPSLPDFLEGIALYTDLDSYDTNSDSVVLMTIHAAKGLEFDHVFVAGMDEGVFPGRSVGYNPQEVEEERRLCYVAITRAKKRLCITTAAKRMLFGQTSYNAPSRFIAEIPAEHTEHVDHSTPRPAPVRKAAGPAPKKDWGSATTIGVGSASGSPAKASGESYSPGQRVDHKVFGQGEILTAKAVGGDTLLEVKFEGAGVKRIMANFAKLAKI
ncbi:MAG: UvrD-helicase domain-containing protein [Oscillospiraceae bacterium]|nr:UvrD-helicase domain-containing protein [Oscillospiraceae bacterium]